MLAKETPLADMHLHSSFSDGLYPPNRLVEICARNNRLKAIALTDHESTEGVEEAQKAGRRLGIEVIPGVEIGTVFQGREIHLLGYFASSDSRLEKELSSLRAGRYERMAGMLALLSGKGVKVRMEDVEEEAGEAAPGRLHLARLLHKKGYVTTISEAFERFIGRGKVAYIPRLTLKTEDAISLLNSCGAVPVLAHPGITNENSQSLFHFKKSGLKGIEVYHPEHTPGLTLFYREWARREGLLITGGSDFHGDDKESCPFPGCASVEYRCVEEIKKMWDRAP